jgi:hypothetical protein
MAALVEEEEILGSQERRARASPARTRHGSRSSFLWQRRLRVGRQFTVGVADT